MIVIPSLFEASRDAKRWFKPVVTVGYFDGLHRGHQKLLADLKAWAHEVDGEPLVITFRRHPQVILGGSGPPAILSLEHRLLLLAREGIAGALALSFDEPMSRWTPEEFIERVLKEALGSRHFLLGFDSAIGRGRQGTFAYLSDHRERLGMELRQSTPLLTGGQRISSTLVREAITAGDLGRIDLLTGRPHAVLGTVVRGDGRGKSLGFPTANLQHEAEAVLPPGVYFAEAAVVEVPRAEAGQPERIASIPTAKDTDQWIPAIANFGKRPTFDAPGREAKIQLEAHLIGFEGDLYGKMLEVRFLKFHRGEQKFAGAGELKEQIQKDVAARTELRGAKLH